MSSYHKRDVWVESLNSEELDSLLSENNQMLFLAKHSYDIARFKVDRLEREKARRSQLDN